MAINEYIFRRISAQDWISMADMFAIDEIEKQQIALPVTISQLNLDGDSHDVRLGGPVR